MKKTAPLFAIAIVLQACATAATAPEPKPAEVAQSAPQESKYDKLVNVARKLAGLGQMEKAAKYANEAKGMNPEKSGAWAVLGLLAAQQMDFDGAIRLY